MNETIKRILATLLFLPFVYFVLYSNVYNAVYFFIGILLIGFLAYNELSKLLRRAGFFHTFVIPIALISLYCSLFFKAYFYIGSIFILTLLLETAYWIKKESDFHKSFHNILSGLFILFYLGVMWGSTIPLRQFNDLSFFDSEDIKWMSGSLHFLVLITGTWMCDIGAYFGGRNLGKTKLHLSISPNKTLEGFISGIVTSIISLFIVCYLVDIQFNIFMLLIPFGAIIGDLFESLIKRLSGTKDSGSLIPGHGGILDVFDALIVTAPLYYFCIIMWSV